MPFVRTPKCARPSAVLQALTAVREEFLILISLCLAVFVLSLVPREYGSPDLRVWCFVLLIQAIPYGAAVLVSFVSSFRWPARQLGGGIKRNMFPRAPRVQKGT